MGFLTYFMDFYRRECRRLQNEAPTADTLCRARRLLKLLDDLLDEGYAELAERLEAEQMGPSFLRGWSITRPPFPCRQRNLMHGSFLMGRRRSSFVRPLIALFLRRSARKRRKHRRFCTDCRIFAGGLDTTAKRRICFCCGIPFCPMRIF